MAQEVKRIKLDSLTDIQRQMSRLYREHRQGDLSDSQLSAASMHLKRLHDMVVQEREVDVTEQLALIEEKLYSLQKKR